MRRIVVHATVAAALFLPGRAGAAVYFDFHRITNTGSVLYETWQDTSTGKVYAQQSWRGTPRQELFIHSEETASNGQYCPTIYDDPFCWDGDFDYKSAGCIKLSRAAPYPSDLGQAHSDWDGWSGAHGYVNLYH